MADGRVGQQPFHVVLEDREEGTEQQRDDAGPADQPGPFGRAAQRWPQADQQEHAGLDHRGRVQVGRYRRRRGHRMGQPEVERELRALGQRAQRHQDQGRQVQRMGADLVAGGEHRIELVAANDVAQDQYAGEQAQAAGGGDGERHARTAAGIVTVLPIADQEEGREAGEFPEHHQLDQVAGQDHAHHRAHECQHVGIEARHRIFLGHVVARVQDHQEANAEHHDREQPGQAVHAHDEVQAEQRQPLIALQYHLAGAEFVEFGDGDDERCQGEHAGNGGGPVARGVGQAGGNDGAREGEKDEEDQWQ